jgi:hypothetical protein
MLRKYLSMAQQLLVGPWPLFQFLDLLQKILPGLSIQLDHAFLFPWISQQYFFTEQDCHPCIQPNLEDQVSVFMSSIEFPFRCLLPLAELRWRYSNPLPRGE